MHFVSIILVSVVCVTSCAASALAMFAGLAVFALRRLVGQLGQSGGGEWLLEVTCAVKIKAVGGAKVALVVCNQHLCILLWHAGVVDVGTRSGTSFVDACV